MGTPSLVQNKKIIPIRPGAVNAKRISGAFDPGEGDFAPVNAPVAPDERAAAPEKTAFAPAQVPYSQQGGCYFCILYQTKALK